MLITDIQPGQLVRLTAEVTEENPDEPDTFMFVMATDLDPDSRTCDDCDETTSVMLVEVTPTFTPSVLGRWCLDHVNFEFLEPIPA